MNNKKPERQLIITVLMWLALLLLILTSFSSCSMPVRKIVVEEKVPDLSLRSTKYINCVTKLNREGIKQSLIETLCNQSLGGLE